jgi:hypothetical protein
MTDELERSEVIVGGISDSFYLRPEEDDRVYTPPEVLSWLMKCELILECLMKNGVAHWEGYDSSMEEFHDAWKK